MSNVDTARSAYEAFGRGDLAALQDDFAEDAVWYTSEELPLGGETRGREAIIANFAQIPNYWSSFSVEPNEFIDAGDTVVVLGHPARRQRQGQLRSALRPPDEVRRRRQDGARRVPRRQRQGGEGWLS